MNNDAINRAVAISVGWTQHQARDGWLAYSPPGNSKLYLRVSELPRWSESLDACAEFEATLTGREHSTYLAELAYACGFGTVRPSDDAFDEMIFACATATALQRCTAYLKLRGIAPEQPAPSGANFTRHD